MPETFTLASGRQLVAGRKPGLITVHCKFAPADLEAIELLARRIGISRVEMVRACVEHALPQIEKGLEADKE